MSGDSTDRARDRETLKARARDLARVPAVVAEGTTDMMVFRLAGEHCAVPALWLHDVARRVQVAPLPGAEPPVTAIAAWRGVLLPVVDLRSLLGLPEAGSEPTPDADLRLLVLGRETAACGVMADEVEGMRAMEGASIRVPEEGVARRREFIDGVTDDAVMVISAERLLGLEL